MTQYEKRAGKDIAPGKRLRKLPMMRNTSEPTYDWIKHIPCTWVSRDISMSKTKCTEQGM